MPTDLTGTPTSLGIGTYNTSADAPSGLGFNAAMAQIDALLLLRVSKPAGIVSGEAPVWNGSTWVRSSATPLGTTSLGTGTPGAGKYVDGAAGAWTTLPSGVLNYRKNTIKTVNTTISATDLLNGEITVGAGALTATGILRFRAWGDWLHNGGANSAPPRFQLVLGGTTILDTGTSGAITAGTNRATWEINAIIQAVNATNSQESTLNLLINAINQTTTQVGNTFTTPATSGQMTSQNVLTNFTVIQAQGSNASALDMTSSKTLALNTILATNSATEEIKLFGALIEVV